MSYFRRHAGVGADEADVRVLGCHRDIGRLPGANVTFLARLKQTGQGIKCTSLLRDTRGFIPCWINLPTLTARSTERGWDAGLKGGHGSYRRHGST